MPILLLNEEELQHDYSVVVITSTETRFLHHPECEACRLSLPPDEDLDVEFIQGDS